MPYLYCTLRMSNTTTVAKGKNCNGSVAWLTQSCLPLPKYTHTHRCAICQVEFEEGEDALLLPCKHLFHADCIDIWLADNKCCPVCKQEIED